MQLLAPVLALAVIATLMVGALTGEAGLGVDLIKKAAGFSDGGSTVGGGDFSQLLSAGETLLPLGLVLTIAAFPIVCVVGGACLAFGAKIGVKLVAMAFGACLFMSVVGGLSA